MSHFDHGEAEAKRTINQGRSPKWRKVEQEYLKDHPNCACCKAGTNTGAGVQVHHKFPFHYCIALGRPDLELDERNLITLCEDEVGKPGQNHHLLVGHLDNFQSSNLAVEHDATTTFFGMTAAMIKTDSTWRAEVTRRLKPLDQMTEKDKVEFTKLMNETYPRSDGDAPSASIARSRRRL